MYTTDLVKLHKMLFETLYILTATKTAKNAFFVLLFLFSCFIIRIVKGEINPNKNNKKRRNKNGKADYQGF